MTESEIEYCNRVWGQGNWYTHECSVNGDTKLITHSTHYHDSGPASLARLDPTDACESIHMEKGK